MNTRQEFFQQLTEQLEKQSQFFPAADIPESELEKFYSDNLGEAVDNPQLDEDIQSDYGKCNMEQLRNMAMNCRKCPLAEGRHNVVFGDGDEHAQLMFIGEGPGYDEDMQGVPFVGKAGKLLDRMIAAMLFTRAQVYIANIVKCRPPGNRNPEEDEAACCLPYLERQIELIKPKVLVLLGAVPLKYLMKRTGIKRHRGNFLEYNDIPVMPTYHPAFLLRFTEAKREAWSDLQQVMRLLDKTP